MRFFEAGADSQSREIWSKQGDMGRDDAPAFRQADPGLALASKGVGALAVELGIGRGEVHPVGRYHRTAQRTRQTGRRPRGAERLDLRIAVQVLAGAVAQGTAVVPEQRIEGSH